MALLCAVVIHSKNHFSMGNCLISAIIHASLNCIILALVHGMACNHHGYNSECYLLDSNINIGTVPYPTLMLLQDHHVSV